MAGVTTLEEAKKGLNMTSSSNDEEVGRFLEAAIEQVESIVGPIRPTTITERVDTVYDGTVILRQLPVLSVTSIAARVGGAELYVTDDLDLDPGTGAVRLASGGSIGSTWGGLTVTYEAGRDDDVPEAVRVATIIILEHLWRTQRGTSRAPTARGESPSTADEMVAPMGFALPSRAVQLLEPYALLAI